jgi:hypothetical protein
VSGEVLGIPSVGIMTEKFVSAAKLMAQVLGADGYPFVVIPHPISSASAGALEESARAAAKSCVVSLTKDS